MTKKDNGSRHGSPEVTSSTGHRPRLAWPGPGIAGGIGEVTGLIGQLRQDAAWQTLYIHVDIHVDLLPNSMKRSVACAVTRDCNVLALSCKDGRRITELGVKDCIEAQLDRSNCTF